MIRLLCFEGVIILKILKILECSKCLKIFSFLVKILRFYFNVVDSEEILFQILSKILKVQDYCYFAEFKHLKISSIFKDFKLFPNIFQILQDFKEQ